LNRDLLEFGRQYSYFISPFFQYLSVIEVMLAFHDNADVVVMAVIMIIIVV